MRLSYIYLLFVLLVISCSSDDSAPTTSPVLPTAIFSSNVTEIQTGETVRFINQSVEADSYAWVFEGGTPNVSTAAEPTVTYSSPGMFSVTLTVGNADGEDQEIKSGFITVNQQEASYTVTFQGNWTEETHPTEYPNGDHFSSAVGMVHNTDVSLFTLGELASDPMERMAENGANARLSNEVASMITNGSALSYINGGDLNTGGAQRSFTISVNEMYSLVTIVSMIAPSPDWFVAIQDVDLFEQGAFINELTLPALSYDAGTDSGQTYTSQNADTDPAEPISLIKDAPLGNGNTVDPPAAFFTFTKN